MERKDYYTLKEIILGLRSEYKEFKLELQKLEKYLEFEKKNIIKSNISTIHNPNRTGKNRDTILCEYYVKRNKLSNLICEFLYKFQICLRYLNIYPYYSAYYNIEEEKFKRSYRDTNVNINNIDEFLPIANKILNSDFMQKNQNRIIFDEDNLKSNISFSSYKIEYNSRGLYNLDYYYGDDQIEMLFDEAPNMSMFLKLLDTKIPKKLLDEYQKNIIEKHSETLDKKIILPNDIEIKGSEQCFDLVEESKQIVLKKSTFKRL